MRANIPKRRAHFLYTPFDTGTRHLEFHVPLLLGGVFTNESASGVAVAEGYVCIANRFGGLVLAPRECTVVR